MNKILEAITTSIQIYPTATSGKTGSVSVDMSPYTHAIGKLFAHRLPDGKGEGVITLSLYENVGTGATGSVITASIKTASITSASDVYLETEIKDIQLSKNSTKRYVNAYVASATPTVISVEIERAGGRYDPQ
jgi:hypothetical protein